MNIIACNRRYAHEHVDRIMGHLVVVSGIRCQVILMKNGLRDGKFGEVLARGIRIVNW